MRAFPTSRLLICAMAVLFAMGCSESPQFTDTNAGSGSGSSTASFSSVPGDEELGDFPVANGSGVVIAGVGLVDAQPGDININVPGTPVQSLLYWCGHNQTDGTDVNITLDGAPLTGTLIGGPTSFFGGAWSSTVRKDISSMGKISSGPNTISVGGLDFTTGCPSNCQNLGAGLMVIYNDGSEADIQVKDGNDNAFIGFAEPLKTTKAITYTFAASSEARTAELCMFAASVAQFPSEGGRPTVVEVTSGASTQRFVDVFQGNEGDDFDAVCLDNVNVPAGATSMTVQALSERDPSSTFTGQEASFSWMACALTITPPREPEPEITKIGDRVWCDYDMDGIQDLFEPGKAGVTVELRNCAGDLLDTEVTGPMGIYYFSNLEPGDYYVCFILPDGFVFSPQNQGLDDRRDSDADETTGCATCTTLEAGEKDRTWDAGMYEPIEVGEGCTPGYWKNHPLVWAATGLSPDDYFDDVMGCTVFGYDLKLIDALRQGGGNIYRLGRHGTAALLSALHPNVDYGLSVDEVKALVCSGSNQDTSKLAWENERGCPLDKEGDRNDESNGDDGPNLDN